MDTRAATLGSPRSSVAYAVFILLLWEVRCDNLTVHTQSGFVSGTLNTATLVRSFVGIPYAAPPLGALRWVSPQPPQAWTGTYAATTAKPECPQNNDVNPTSEDCLYLNVFTPNTTNGTLLPVLFWIHGGWMTTGGAQVPVYDAANIVWKTGNIVVVQIQYRLGTLGFLGSELLRSTASNNSTGVYGLQDQRFAMAWVQANIAAFGGDPTKVTIWGQSSGAECVGHHLTMPLSRGRGYYRAAITDSGTFTFITVQQMSSKEFQFQFVLNYTNCANVDCLRQVPVATIVNAEYAYMNLSGINFGAAFHPALDLVEILVDPQINAQNGNVENVPIMLGTNLNEGTALLTSVGTWAYPTMPASLLPTAFQMIETLSLLPQADWAAATALYNVSNFSSPYAAAAAMFGDMLMVCPTRRVARWLTGRASAQPVYLYSFQYELQAEANAPSFSYLGVPHGSELLFIFDDIDLDVTGYPTSVTMTSAEQLLALKIMAHWTSMAETLSPNDGDTPAWPTYSNATDQNIQINTVSTVVSGWTATRCNFWDQFTYFITPSTPLPFFAPTYITPSSATPTSHSPSPSPLAVLNPSPLPPPPTIPSTETTAESEPLVNIALVLLENGAARPQWWCLAWMVVLALAAPVFLL